MENIVNLIFARDTAQIEALIKSGEFNVNGYVSLGRSALALAAACNYLDVMQCLIDNGADINLMDEGDLGYTPIETAAREGNVDAIKLLIKYKAEIDKGNTIDSNALIGACIGAHQEAIEVLLENGSNINHTDNNGQTALHYLSRYAKQWGSSKITQTVDGVTEELENPRFQQHTAVFNTLLQKGADVTLETNYGYTPLHLCAETDTHSFIADLVSKGANVNAQNARGFSPLHAAADLGNLDACIELINHGADVNIVDMDGFTPILGAVSSKNLELVKLLLEKGAVKDIKAKTSYGNVAEGDDTLSLAEKLENTELLDLLQN